MKSAQIREDGKKKLKLSRINKGYVGGTKPRGDVVGLTALVSLLWTTGRRVMSEVKAPGSMWDVTTASTTILKKGRSCCLGLGMWYLFFLKAKERQGKSLSRKCRAKKREWLGLL